MNRPKSSLEAVSKFLSAVQLTEQSLGLFQIERVEMNVSQREYDVTLCSAVWLGPEV